MVSEADNGRPSGTDKQDDQYVRDVRTAFAGVPKLRPQWVDKYMTILVVGESGLGEPFHSDLGHGLGLAPSNAERVETST